MKRAHFVWRLRTRTLLLGERTLLMGIVNITPDSFSDGGRFLDPQAATNHAFRLLEEGADLLDLGAESTRPGAKSISAEEEQDRLLPVLRAVLLGRPDAIVSVDTYHAATAQAAVDAGAEIVNDVSGLLWDSEMGATLARTGAGAILMHTRGKPTEWQSQPRLKDDEVTPVVVQGLIRIVHNAEAAGIPRDSIVIDPGFGFGKLGVENFALMRHFVDFDLLELPILSGTSRKRFLTAHLAQPTEEQQLLATSASHVAAILGGAHILRVHDVSAARVTAFVADSILDGSSCASKP